jgi:hypothetical protein
MIRVSSSIDISPTIHPALVSVTVSRLVSEAVVGPLLLLEDVFLSETTFVLEKTSMWAEMFALETAFVSETTFILEMTLVLETTSMWAAMFALETALILETTFVLATTASLRLDYRLAIMRRSALHLLLFTILIRTNIRCFPKPHPCCSVMLPHGGCSFLPKTSICPVITETYAPIEVGSG